MHLKKIRLLPDCYPAVDQYPFNVPALRETREIPLATPMTFFVGENGSGKSTLLEAVARRCGIHIWTSEYTTRLEHNPHEGEAPSLHGRGVGPWQRARLPTFPRASSAPLPR